MKFLAPSEPGKPLKSRSFSVIFLVEKDVRIERYGTCHYLSNKEVKWQYEIGEGSDEKHRDEEVRRVVAFITKVAFRDQMVFAVVGVMKVDVISKKLSTQRVMPEFAMQKGLPERNCQVRSNRGDKDKRELQKEPRQRLMHLTCRSVTSFYR